MTEVTKVNIKVSGSAGSKKPVAVRSRMPITYDGLIGWIKRQRYDDCTTRGLIAVADTFPATAYHMFVARFSVILQRVREQMKVEQEGEVNVKDVTSQPPRLEADAVSLEDGLRKAQKSFQQPRRPSVKRTPISLEEVVGTDAEWQTRDGIDPGDGEGAPEPGPEPAEIPDAGVGVLRRRGGDPGERGGDADRQALPPEQLPV